MSATKRLLTEEEIQQEKDMDDIKTDLRISIERLICRHIQDFDAVQDLTDKIMDEVERSATWI